MSDRSGDAADSQFDAYHELLGIGASEQPANLYRLLGLTVLEPSPKVIERAADRQMAHLRTFQVGPHAEASQKLLNEVAKARRTLLNEAAKSQYDEALSHAMGTAPQPLAEFESAEEPSSGIPRILTHAGHGGSHRYLPRGVLVSAVGLAVAGLALGAVIWSFRREQQQRVGPPTARIAEASLPSIAPPAVVPPVPPLRTDDAKEESEPSVTNADPEASTQEPTSLEPGSEAAAPLPPPIAPPAPDDTEKLRAEIGIAAQTLPQLPALKKYYDYLQANPESIEVSGPKLAKVLRSELETDETFQKHLPSRLAALQEIERLSAAGRDFQQALQAIDEQANHHPLGPSPEQALEAKSRMLKAAADSARDANEKARLRGWIAELLPTAIAQQNGAIVAELLAADGKLMRSSIDRLQVIALLMPQAKQALQQEQLPIADAILTYLEQVIVNTTPGKPRKVASDDTAALRARLGIAQAAVPASTKLAEDPSDAAAHQAVGLHVLLNRGLWLESLDHFSQGSDPKWRELAEASLVALDGKAKAAAAASWAALSTEELSAPRTLARYLYNEALADSAFIGIARVAAENQARLLGPAEEPVVRKASKGPSPHEILLGYPIVARRYSILTESIAENPKSAEAHHNRAQWHIARQQWREALKDLETYLTLHPGDSYWRGNALAMCLLLDDTGGRQRHRAALLEQLPTAGDGGQTHILRALSLDPEISAQSATLKAVIENLQAKEAMQKDTLFQRFRPGILYRNGDYAEVIALTDKSLPRGPDRTFNALPWLFRIMALAKLNKDGPAQDELKKLKAFLQRDVPYEWGEIHYYTTDSLHVQILYREAARLILRRMDSVKFAELTIEDGFEETVESLTRLITAHPQDANSRLRRAQMHHRAHRWEQAADDYQAGIQLQPTNLWKRQDLAITSIGASREEAYLQQCREIESQLRNLTAPDIQHTRAARILSLRPGGFADGEKLLAMASKMAENSKDWPLVHPRVSLLYRLQRYEDVLREAHRIPLKDLADQRAPMHAWEAMALWQLGRRPEARDALGLARRYMKEIRASRDKPWGDTDVVIEAVIALAEAEALIK